MPFKKYQHIERIGSIETQGIENGTCFIFPKIDGTNGQLWLEDGLLRAGSRNRDLSLDNDNAGFYNAMVFNSNILSFFIKYPKLVLYGEWLVPHTLKTYSDDAWRKFYVFDVMDDYRNLPYDEYKVILDEFNIEYIPPICKIENPTYERLVGLLEKNTYLVQDGKGTGEGIVIKNYDYVNKFGRQTWAKIVKNEFKASHSKVQITELQEKKMIEQEIADKFITKTLVDKEFSKIEIEGWTSKMIPRLLNTIFYCLIKEESWNIIKEFKNPTIDYRRLQYITNTKIKEHKPEIF